MEDIYKDYKHKKQVWEFTTDSEDETVDVLINNFLDEVTTPESDKDYNACFDYIPDFKLIDIKYTRYRSGLRDVSSALVIYEGKFPY